MKSNYIVVVITLVIIIGGAFYLFNINSTKQDQTPASVSVQQAQTPVSAQGENKDATSAGAVSDVKEVIVEGSPFKFLPAEIKVKKGQTLKVVFKNMQGMHDFVVDEFSAKTKVIKAGESEAVELVADKAGTFEYYCSVGNHRSQGMKGSLIVE